MKKPAKKYPGKKNRKKEKRNGQQVLTKERVGEMKELEREKNKPGQAEAAVCTVNFLMATKSFTKYEAFHIADFFFFFSSTSESDVENTRKAKPAQMSEEGEPEIHLSVAFPSLLIRNWSGEIPVPPLLSHPRRRGCQLLFFRADFNKEKKRKARAFAFFLLFFT